jgi:hypothetical protein
MTGLLLTFILSFSAPPFEAHTLDGQTVSGALVELTADRLNLDTARGRVSLETGNILTLSVKGETKPAAQKFGVIVELTDGSTIHGRQYVARGGQARITLDDGEVIEAPMSVVQSVRLQQSDPLDAEWSRLTEAKSDNDLMVVRANESLDLHKGVINDVTEDTVAFDLDGEVLPIKRSKIYGFVYRHGVADELPAAICQITDASGSHWSARSVKLAGKMEWVTPTGLSVSQPLERVSRLDFSQGKLVYLGDMTPDAVNWTPYFGAERPLPALRLFYAPRFNRGFESDTLKLNGTEYRKGLALFARTELVYRLPKGFTHFIAVAGVDEAGSRSGKVRLTIRADDRVLLETDLAGKDAPQSIDLDISGVRRLTIMVDFGDDLGTGDRLLLCNARIVK